MILETTVQAAGLAAAAVWNHCLDDPEREVVGLVLSDGQAFRLINQSRSKSRFEVSAAQLESVLDDLPDDTAIAAIYHSHPGGTLDLSMFDQTMLYDQYAAGLPIPWLIVTPDGRLKLWTVDHTTLLPVGFNVEATIHVPA